MQTSAKWTWNGALLNPWVQSPHSANIKGVKDEALHLGAAFAFNFIPAFFLPVPQSMEVHNLEAQNPFFSPKRHNPAKNLHFFPSISPEFWSPAPSTSKSCPDNAWRWAATSRHATLLFCSLIHRVLNIWKTSPCFGRRVMGRSWRGCGCRAAWSQVAILISSTCRCCEAAEEPGWTWRCSSRAVLCWQLIYL